MHIDRGDATIKIWLMDLTVAKSRGFRAHEISGIVKLTAGHKEMLTEKWNEYFGEDNR
ncbi:DUF4160 domain-containing protein [Sphingorhabdus arenilitoris]|uniref:DUF4160 domain-containing protein n=1 Tax=Sphingorhabdus arenilitoris TaxID=1490041 RepID=A0ABV8RGT5_9SPHN